MATKLPYVQAADGRDEQLQAGDSLELPPLVNGEVCEIVSQSELLTINNAGSTDTSMTIPAGALPIAVATRVITTIPTAITYQVGIAGSPNIFTSGTPSSAAGTTDAGTKRAVSQLATSATAIRITPSATPATNVGQVRISVWYFKVTPPTS